MMLIKFGDVLSNVRGLDKEAIRQMKYYNGLMERIERRDWFIWLWFGGVVAFLLELLALFMLPMAKVGMIHSITVFSLLCGTAVTYILRSRSKAKNEVDANILGQCLLSRKGQPCADLIRARMVNSKALAKLLEEAAAHADVATVTDLG